MVVVIAGWMLAGALGLKYELSLAVPLQFGLLLTFAPLMLRCVWEMLGGYFAMANAMFGNPKKALARLARLEDELANLESSK